MRADRSEIEIGERKCRTAENETARKQGIAALAVAPTLDEAAILAARRNKKVIGTSEFTEALERIVAGPERKSRIISDAEKAIIAFHEGGHAVVQRILPKCDPVAKVTIISRGMALGYTMGLPTEDRYLKSKTEFEDEIAGMLAGNAAERLIFGDTTTGSSNDIAMSVSSHSRVNTEKTRPPRTTRSAGSSPRATASRRARSGMERRYPCPSVEVLTPRSLDEALRLKAERLDAATLVDDLSLVYNKKLFDQAGLSYPTDEWSWDDFRTAARKLTNASTHTYGWAYVNDGSEDTVWRFWALLWQAGGNILTPDGKKAAFDSSRARYTCTST